MSEHSAGWYPDPAGDATKIRYWDGTQWTNNYANASALPPQPPVVVRETFYSNSPGGYGQPSYYVQPAYYPMDSSKKAMRMVAFVFNIIATVSFGFLIFPLAWMIPMTVMSWGIYKGTRRNTIAFGVCCLIFMGVVSGILLLVSGDDQ